MSDALSVIIPVRSMAQELAACLRSFAPERGDDDEIVVVDDGSDDDSVAVAEGLGARVVRTSTPAGPYAARNLGADVAVNDRLLFVDARCRARPGLLAAHRALLVRPAVALSCTAVQILPGPSFAGRVAVGVDAFRLDTKVGVPGRLDFYPTANLGVVRETFRQVGGFEPVRSGGDALLCWEVQARGLGVLAADPRVLVQWQARPSLRGLAEQTFRYGRSARALEERHRDALARARARGVLPSGPVSSPSLTRDAVPHDRAAALAASVMNLAFRAGRTMERQAERRASRNSST